MSNSEQIKAQMGAARRLIEDKRYGEALALLETVDHPKAREWEARLRSRIEPEKPKNEKRKNQPKKRLRNGLIGAIVVLVLGFCVVALLVAPSSEELAGTETVQAVAAAGTATVIALTPPTSTPEPSATPLPSATPTVTNTPLPTSTQEPEDAAMSILRGVIGPQRAVERVLVNDLVVTLRWELSGFSGPAARQQGDRDIVTLSCRLRDAGFDQQRYQLAGLITVYDTTTGNERTAEGIEVVVPPSVYQAFNCDNAIIIDIEAALRFSDDPDARYDVHRLLLES